MKKTILAVSAAAILITGLMIVGVATAQPRDDRPGYGGGGYWGCPYYPGAPGGDTLNLTADQQKKLVNLQEKYATENDKITDDIVKVERDLRKLYTAEKPDLKAIDKAEDQIKGLMDKRFTLGREFRNSARALLTDEQLKANPYVFTGPGSCLGYGPGYGSGMRGGGMMGGYGPGRGRW
ncbi:MAG: periplasmic heavy metal sensor [Deltaproteobacteria bacterium]|nr:periplasmic heavy metal sensor [Candidatus Zymogenaceae bacterium]